MKKANRIRLICALAAVLCCMAYGGGYYFGVQQPKEEEHTQFLTLEEPEEEEEDPKETAQSTAQPVSYEFVLCEEEGYVMVYYADRETVYDTTDIRLEDLPANLQQEIREGKEMGSQQELYNFLESYSS